LKLKYDLLLSSFAFDFNLRRYIKDELFKLFEDMEKIQTQLDQFQ